MLPNVPPYYDNPRLEYKMAQTLQLAMDAGLGWLTKAFHIAKVGITAEDGLTYPQVYANDGSTTHHNISPDSSNPSYCFFEVDRPALIDADNDTIEYFFSVVFWQNLDLVDISKQYDFTSELMEDVSNILALYEAETINVETRPERIFDKYTQVTQELKQFLLQRYSGFKITFSVTDSYTDNCVGESVDSCEQNIERIENLPTSVKNCVLASVCPTPTYNISNSDNSYDVDITSNLVLPDIQVTDSDGSVSSYPSVKDVVCTPVSSLTADFSADDTTPVTGQTVSFTDESTGSPTEWFWDFGDDQGYSTEQNPSYTYGVAGAYDVTLYIYRNGYLCDILTKSSYITVSYDSDAQTFITAAGITGTTQKNALNQFVLDLKGTGSTVNNLDLWSLFDNTKHSIHPYCPIDGATANATCYSYNLIDPTKFQFTFNNFVAGDFTIYGVTGGSTKYASTGIIPSTHVSINNCGFDVYLRTNNNNLVIEFGVTDASFTNAIFFAPRFSAANQFLARINDSTSVSNVFSNDSRGLYSMQRTLSNNRDFGKNGLTFFSDSIASTSLSSNAMTAHARNANGTIDVFSDRQCAGFCLNRPSFTAAQLKDWEFAWDKYQNNIITGGRLPT